MGEFKKITKSYETKTEPSDPQGYVRSEIEKQKSRRSENHLPILLCYTDCKFHPSMLSYLCT